MLSSSQSAISPNSLSNLRGSRLPLSSLSRWENQHHRLRILPKVLQLVCVEILPIWRPLAMNWVGNPHPRMRQGGQAEHRHLPGAGKDFHSSSECFPETRSVPGWINIPKSSWEDSEMFVLRRFIDLVPTKKEISQVKSGRTNTFLKIFSSPQHSKKEIQCPATRIGL